MQLHSDSAELRALLSITNERIKEDKRTLWLGKLNAEMFHSPIYKRIFERVDKLARKRFTIVSFKSLLEDPTLDEDMRAMLKTTREKPCRNSKAWRETLETLSHYRKLRLLYFAAANVLDKMEESAVDMEALVSSLSGALSRVNSTSGEEEFFLHFGANDTSEAVVDSILNNEVIPRIKTGFRDYDERSGGFPESGVVILAATTSGGKSTLAMNICRYMYMENNLSTFRVTLEMQDLQETQRLLSHLTKIPLKKFTQAKLTVTDKALIKKKYNEFRAHGKKHGINYTTFSPKANMTMDSTIRTAKPFGYKVLVVDYVGLLDDEGKDQWRALMDAARVAKNYSRETGALVILLAQLDDDSDKLRYSRGMKEHADVLWQWNYTKPEQRELRILPVVVAKDRDAELYSFELEERYDVMTASNIGESENTLAYEDDEEKGDETPKRKKKKSKQLHDTDDGPPALS